ncbi:MAG: ABC transporter ATP-binding protein, partial [Anaerolineales bacterium]
MDNVISVKNLTKMFGDFTAVDNITFDVKKGEIFGFLGPNGSGKTTTIRMMLGLLPPTSGDVDVLGIDINQQALELRSRIGYMSQKFSLYNDLTVRQNLKFYGAAYGLSPQKLEKRIAETLEMAGLKGKGNIKTQELSGGWRQRLALGVAILHNPEVIFLDEPTAGVDPVSRRAFWELLYELVKQEVTVFVTTHYMDEA